MTPDQARIILLEDALIQSYHTISFLHGCLINPSPITPIWWNRLMVWVGFWRTKGCRYSYSFPDQTVQGLKAIEQLVTIPESCLHSIRHPSCPRCAASIERSRLRTRARAVLGISYPP